MGSTGVPSNELRKLIEKKPKKLKGSLQCEKEPGSPKNGLFELAQEFDESELLAKRDSAERQSGKGDWSDDFISKSHKKTKEPSLGGKASPYYKFGAKTTTEQRPSRSTMALPEVAHHLRMIPSKRMASAFNNPFVPCLPQSLTN